MMPSRLAFRNVDVQPENPVETWPQEAIATALARGGLSDWCRIVAAVTSGGAGAGRRPPPNR